jgi:cytochrome oxidase Cu insertion factor (SCO1/SenC/PrrC family)
MFRIAKITLFVIISSFIIYVYYSVNKDNEIKSHINAIGEINSDFELVSHKGVKVSSKQFKDKIMLVYFGFTYCPDVCPTGLQMLSEIISQMGSDADKIQAVFITIDPNRDTVEQLNRYMANFHHDIIALTGTEAEIVKVANHYKVQYSKTPADGPDYLLNHTSLVYVCPPSKPCSGQFYHNSKVEDIVKKLKSIIYNK